MAHLKKQDAQLHRIYYYDSPPSQKVVMHPLIQKSVNLGKTDQYRWMTEFHSEIVKLRKVAFRRGELLESTTGYQLRPDSLKRLMRSELTIADLTESDFYLNISQKGVDMRVGLDIASLSSQMLVNQIIMVSGDSDFVPAAKYARRAGIDFILDPMWSNISSSLHEHVDGLYTPIPKPMSH